MCVCLYVAEMIFSKHICVAIHLSPNNPMAFSLPFLLISPGDTEIEELKWFYLQIILVLFFFFWKKTSEKEKEESGQNGKVLDEDNLEKLLKLLLTFVAIK